MSLISKSARVLANHNPGLTLAFGNLTLRASSCLNLRCVEVVLFTGRSLIAG